MNELISLNEYNWAYWVAGGFALFEFFKCSVNSIDWLFNKFGIETKRMREKREWQERLTKTEKDIDEIKKNSDRNVEMFLEHEKAVVEKFTGIKDEIIGEINKLHDKIDEQKSEMDATNEANIKTDCAMLRDRIASGMRYFNQRKGEDGKVHISLSEYENMEALFQEYFAKNGNGTFHKMYEEEFKHFCIDQ